MPAHPMTRFLLPTACALTLIATLAALLPGAARADVAVPLPANPGPAVTAISPAAGPIAGGTPVTITGTDFTGATDVDFGSTSVTSFSVNAMGTQITVTSPAETAGTVDVTVVNGTTSSILSADQFTFDDSPTVTGITPGAGPTAGGSTVTITGTGLADATGVSFGSVAATGPITVISDTQITVPAPPAATTDADSSVDVTVTNETGTSAANPPRDQFRYDVAPALSASNPVTPNAGPTSGGSEVIITGTGFDGTTEVLFGSTPVAPTTVYDNEIVATAPAEAAGPVDVYVVTPGGETAQSASDQFTFDAAPTVTGVTPSAGPVAGGTQVTITGTNFVEGATTVSFGGRAPSGMTVNSPTQITATSPLGPPASTT